MDIEIKTYFEEDVKEYAYCAMLKVLVKRLKKATGIDLSRLDEVSANKILRDLIQDFYSMSCGADGEEEDELGNSWLCLAWGEMEEIKE